MSSKRSPSPTPEDTESAKRAKTEPGVTVPSDVVEANGGPDAVAKMIVAAAKSVGIEAVCQPASNDEEPRSEVMTLAKKIADKVDKCCELELKDSAPSGVLAMLNDLERLLSKANTLVKKEEIRHPVNIAGPFDVTPLHTAAGNAAPRTLEVLLRYDTDLNARNCFGETPFRRLTTYGSDRENGKECTLLFVDAMVDRAARGKPIDKTLDVPLKELHAVRVVGGNVLKHVVDVRHAKFADAKDKAKERIERLKAMSIEGIANMGRVLKLLDEKNEPTQFEAWTRAFNSKKGPEAVVLFEAAAKHVELAAKAAEA